MPEDVQTVVTETENAPAVAIRGQRNIVEFEVTNEIADEIIEGIKSRKLIGLSLNTLEEILTKKFDRAGLKRNQIVRGEKGLHTHKLQAIDRIQRILGSAMIAKTKTKHTATRQNIDITEEKFIKVHGEEAWKQVVGIAEESLKQDESD